MRKMWCIIVTASIAIFVAGISTWRTLQNIYAVMLLRIFDYAHDIVNKALKAQDADDRELANELMRRNRFCSFKFFKTPNSPKPPVRRNRSRNRQTLQQKQMRARFLDCIGGCCMLMNDGFKIIMEDEVTPRFVSEELKSWNLLSRHLSCYKHLSWKLKALWFVGIILRYMLLFPVRLMLICTTVSLLCISTAILGQLPAGNWKRKIVPIAVCQMCRAMACSLSAVLRFHNTEYRPKNGICVANHTSPLDVLVLMSDANYSLIGQRHGGFLGMIQNALSRVSPHMWFERAEAKDRQAVGTMLRTHISTFDNPPILIFPEGTCINNTSVMKFKKGSFEASEVITPIAIKYDSRFGDAFWDSSRFSIIHYVFLMISSWSIVCDVWYMPPMLREANESSIDFASRVKREIANKAGLVDLDWDGNLKRWNPKRDWTTSLISSSKERKNFEEFF